MNPILLDGYLECLSNATGPPANEALFIEWLFLQDNTISNFRDF
jgi:hypothetical protein